MPYNPIYLRIWIYASNKNVKHTGPNYLLYQGPLLYSEPQGILQKQSGRKPSENSEKVKIHLNKDFYSFLFNSLGLLLV